MQYGTILVIIGYSLVAIGSVTVFWGDKLNQEKSERKIVTLQERIMELQKETLEGIEYLKKVAVKGDQVLVKQTNEQLSSQSKKLSREHGSLNFRIGTIVFHVERNNLFSNKELNLLIVSEDKRAFISFRKDRNDFAKFVYEFPGIGKLEKGYQIVRSDLQNHQVGLFGGKREFESVFFAFAWNADEKKITLWVNAVQQ